MRGIRCASRKVEKFRRAEGTAHSVSILTAERVVFNIKGNDYRLIASINYGIRYCCEMAGNASRIRQDRCREVEYDKTGILVRPIRSEEDYGGRATALKS